MIPRLVGRASARLQQPRSLAVLGGASLALAVGVAFLPWLFPAAIFRPLSAILASPGAILLVAGAAGLLGAQALRTSARPADDDGENPRARWTPAKEPERAHYEEYRTTGDGIDSVFDADPDERRELASRRRRAESRIRRTAITVIADADRIDEERAAERVAAGSWTDDPRAAAFLGGRHLAPLRTRIRDWASGKRYERWATRAVEEIEAIDRGERTRPAESAETRDLDGEPDDFDTGFIGFDTELDELDRAGESPGEPVGSAPEADREREVAR
ncbi:hypothetical protein M0R89_20005 (plasmid) [Halorussus limi]|uniref:Uncharacterized protein n=1 Tax=Halorussus limi TaxID=2938695 RepID=A0A8U0HZT8_9EURY|nr:hypothetical protein [Halorussus limi]UPV76448.1 hypothetical protein M0R89_20005 [Halorussus limi]